MTGIVLRAVSSFYTVEAEGVLYECKARKNLKKDRYSIVPGDKVRIQVLDPVTGESMENKAVIEDVFERTNFLLRPPIANVTTALLFFSVFSPSPNLSLIDRFMVQAESQNLEIILAFNKMDLDDGIQWERLSSIYENLNYEVVALSADFGLGIERLKTLIQNKITVIAGPSGAGKSSFINTISEHLDQKTSHVSNKIGRGRHTTRYVELLKVGDGTWIADSPGFSTLALDGIDKQDLKHYFIDFQPYDQTCKFGGDCLHDAEPQCGVKMAVSQEKIHSLRYESYLRLLHEIETTKRKGR